MSTAALTPLEATIARRIDFPTWLPAMLVKELRQGVRARGFVGALFGFQVLMTLFTVFAIAGGSGSGSFNLLQGAFWVMLDVQLLIVTPARALSGLQHELDTRWIDLLMLTRLTAWRTVLGKWISLLAQSALLVIAMLPYGVARYFFGSIDLVGEAQLIAMIFVVSAVLTAAALWLSALPKLARVGLGIIVIWLWQFMPGSLTAFIFSGSRPAFTTAPSLTAGGWGLFAFNAGLVLVLCLTGAVRRLAPRAESQTLVTRLLPLLAIAPLIGLRGQRADAQAGMALVVFLVIAGFELARAEEPMAIHWRPWDQRGAWGRLVGRFVQPGWASATEWVLLLAGASCVAMLIVPNSASAHVILLALLAAEALVFPALMLTWMTSQFTHRAAGYALVLGGASVLGAVGSASGSLVQHGLADELLALLPISSFWSRVWTTALPSKPLLIGQVAIAIAVLALAWWRGRPDRERRAAFAATTN